MRDINKVRLYPNGYVFSEKPVPNLPSHFKSNSVSGKFIYYYDENSEKYIYEHDDKFIIIHGHYVYVNINDFNFENPLEHLLNLYFSDYNSFLDEIDLIGGRYVIVIGNRDNVEVYPDATGARTTYYSENEVIASSHVDLMSDNMNLEKNNLGERAELLTYHWNTTPYNNVKSINPNFKVNIVNKKRERFFPRSNNKYLEVPHEKKLETMELLWKEQIDYYCKNYENIIFSISGGADSRVCLAMAKEHMNKMKFFTYSTTEGEAYNTKYTSVLSNDQYIVKQLLKDIDMNHEFFYFDKKQFPLTREQQKIISKNAVKPHGRFLINFYLSSFPEFKVMHMRGTPLEVGRGYFLARDRESSVNEILATYKHNMKKYKENITDDEVLKTFNDAMENFHYKESTFDYHLLDLYYWENRMGRWHSEILNENDVCFETVMPFNMRAMIDISLSYSRVQRRSGYMFNELINRNYPILNFYGKNDKRNLYEQMNENKIENYFSQLEIMKDTEVIETLSTSENRMYIPEKFLSKEYAVQTKIKYTKSAGYLDIKFSNKYYNSKAKNYISFEITINNQRITKEDVTQWSQESQIRLFNLKKDDQIIFTLRPLRDIKRKSWEKASMSYITEIQEYETELEVSNSATSNNPFTEILE